jgi:hypothetical protein
MNLANHCIARDAAQLRSNLTCRETVGPQLLQQLDAFVSPAHCFQVLEGAEIARSSQNPAPSLGNDEVTRRQLLTDDLTLECLETDPPHEMSCLSETNATIRRESGARVALSCVHTFQPRGACRPHLSPGRALRASCVSVSACRERNTSSRRMSGLRHSRSRGSHFARTWGADGNQQIHDSSAAFRFEVPNRMRRNCCRPLIESSSGRDPC